MLFQVVGDRKGSVFGGLVEAPLIPTDKKYQVWFQRSNLCYIPFLKFYFFSSVIDILRLCVFFLCVRGQTVHLFSQISLDNPQYTVPQVLLLYHMHC